MTDRWTAARTAFAEAADWFVRTTREVGERWEAPGLGEWDVRALVGHTSRSLLTVESYLQVPADAVEVGSTADYYRVTSALAAGSAVAERGRQAGAALGDAPSAEVAAIAARVVPRVATCTGAEVITTIAGGMRLADYLPTRTFELVVHTADLSAALGIESDVPPTPAAEALVLAGELAVGSGRADVVLRALTGREALPPGFSLL
ncbi:hypothetical protein F4692_002414 [Nocardioides cavernae]|uniref:Mycothiol-dependent maleylpyruvate isomerase metal-binding domain-containing protein n=1 Tax=Nocardioides cavernae TaxID=1921566 RepID=A0A7Y9H3I6_9ACTN|nr:maleylpyruvate isomerase N-terminal domain-containing protein [Nocardioides cavernae]NYE37281.1 hypothetical protein [Nocardioides cavernae]